MIGGTNVTYAPIGHRCSVAVAIFATQNELRPNVAYSVLDGSRRTPLARVFELSFARPALCATPVVERVRGL